jgi:hypothetical protein
VARAPPDEEMGSMKMDNGKKPDQDTKTGASTKGEPKGEHKH